MEKSKKIKITLGLIYLIVISSFLYFLLSHFNLEDVIKIVYLLKPKKTILTNLHSDLDYNQLLKILPNNILPGYDGLSVNI